MSAFTDQDWNTVLAHLGEIIGPDAQKYAAVPAAKLVAAIPYLADSEDPDRFAVSNLLTFHGAAKARKLFDHRETDNSDILRRLATFHVGIQAEPEVVDYGLNLLALVSLADHEKDAEADRKSGKTNPLNSGAWDVKALRAQIEAELAQNPGLKRMFGTLGSDAIVRGVWN